MSDNFNSENAEETAAYKSTKNVDSEPILDPRSNLTQFATPNQSINVKVDDSVKYENSATDLYLQKESSELDSFDYSKHLDLKILQAYEDDNKDLRSALKALKSKLKFYRQKLPDEVRNEPDSQEKNIECLETSNVTGLIEQLRSDCVKLQQESQEAKKKVRILQDELALKQSLKESPEQASAVLSDEEEDIADLDWIIKRLKSENARLCKENEALKSKLSESSESEFESPLEEESFNNMTSRAGHAKDHSEYNTVLEIPKQAEEGVQSFSSDFMESLINELRKQLVELRMRNNDLTMLLIDNTVGKSETSGKDTGETPNKSHLLKQWVQRLDRLEERIMTRYADCRALTSHVLSDDRFDVMHQTNANFKSGPGGYDGLDTYSKKFTGSIASNHEKESLVGSVLAKHDIDSLIGAYAQSALSNSRKVNSNTNNDLRKSVAKMSNQLDELMEWASSC